MRGKYIDSYFFHTWTEGSAYVLGFIFADGIFTQDPKSPNLKVSISNRDLELLKQIKDLMESEHKISFYKGEYYILSFVNEEIVKKLEELGFARKKSVDLKFPQSIPKEFLPHFIRGYFDGNGYFSYEKHNGNKMRMVSGFILENREFAEKLADVLAEFGLKRVKVLEREKKTSDGTSYELRYYVKDTRKLYDLMYRDATIFLKWKKEYYEENAR